MRILLIGEYSNVHWTLAEGLRTLGHQVTVVSNGDFWKDYPCDISLRRTAGRWGGIAYMARLYSLLPSFRGYDIVQIINPMFLEIKAEHIFPIYKYLRKHNRRVFLCGFGMDYYWVHTCCTHKQLRYSDFNIGDTMRTNSDALKERRDWIGTDKERLNRYIANDCDGIITGLYEYWTCYDRFFHDKTSFVPFPIKPNTSLSSSEMETPQRVKVFIGINKSRNEYKGTDIMLAAAEDVLRKYCDDMILVKAESVPFAQYTRMMNSSDAILDQLYSYTPAMNALEAMSKGIICIGGGEPENYEILHENELRPIVNVLPNYDSVYQNIVGLIANKDKIPSLKRQSIEYIDRHHHYIKVAKRYEEIYERALH